MQNSEEKFSILATVKKVYNILMETASNRQKNKNL